MWEDFRKIVVQPKSSGDGFGNRCRVAGDHHAADTHRLEARDCVEGLLANNVSKGNGSDRFVINQHVDNGVALVAQLPGMFDLRRHGVLTDIIGTDDPDAMPFDDGLGTSTR